MDQGKYLQIESLSTYQASIAPVLVELHAMYLRYVTHIQGPCAMRLLQHVLIVIGSINHPCQHEALEMGPLIPPVPVDASDIL